MDANKNPRQNQVSKIRLFQVVKVKIIGQSSAAKDTASIIHLPRLVVETLQVEPLAQLPGRLLAERLVGQQEPTVLHQLQ